MAKCYVVLSQSPFEDITAFRVRHVLLLVTRRDSEHAPRDIQMGLCRHYIWYVLLTFKNKLLYIVNPTPVIPVFCLYLRTLIMWIILELEIAISSK